MYVPYQALGGCYTQGTLFPRVIIKLQPPSESAGFICAARTPSLHCLLFPVIISWTFQINYFNLNSSLSVCFWRSPGWRGGIGRDRVITLQEGQKQDLSPTALPLHSRAHLWYLGSGV